MDDKWKQISILGLWAIKHRFSQFLVVAMRTGCSVDGLWRVGVQNTFPKRG